MQTMKTKILALISLWLLITPVYAQKGGIFKKDYFGFSFGININYINTELSDTYSTVNSDNATGISLSALYHRKFTEIFAMQTEIEYSHTSLHFTQNNTNNIDMWGEFIDSTITNDNVKINTFSLPVMFQFYTDNFQFGIGFSFNLNSISRKNNFDTYILRASGKDIYFPRSYILYSRADINLLFDAAYYLNNTLGFGVRFLPRITNMTNKDTKRNIIKLYISYRF